MSSDPIVQGLRGWATDPDCDRPLTASRAADEIEQLRRENDNLKSFLRGEINRFQGALRGTDEQ